MNANSRRQLDVALITGAGNGIGREVARLLAKRGRMIAAFDHHAEGLHSLRSECLRDNLVCEIRTVDVTDAETLAAQAADVERHMGPIGLLVACAGVARETPVQGMNARDIERIIRLNLIGVSNSVAAVLPAMLERRRGHVAAISSLASFRGLPNQMAYSASKAGLNALMESLRLDVAQYGIDVTTICPGWTRTRQTEAEFHHADLMPLEYTSGQVVMAIERRLRFHAFPRWVAWQLRLMRLLPVWLQDFLLLRRMRQLKVKKVSDGAVNINGVH